MIAYLDNSIEIFDLDAYKNYTIKVQAVINNPEGNSSIGDAIESEATRTRAKCMKSPPKNLKT